MTAIVIAAQPSRNIIHLATDAAFYTRDNVAVAFGLKITTVPHWPGAVVNTGNAGASPMFGGALSQQFPTWDDAIEGCESVLASMADDFALPSGADIILAGISAERGPEAYTFRIDESVPHSATEEEIASSPYIVEPFKLVKLPDLIMTPVPHDMVAPANYQGIDPDDEPEAVIWSLRKILEMQRQCKLSGHAGGIGGFGQVATISAEGIQQRILQRWPEDVAGTVLAPVPIDWADWDRQNPKPSGGDPTTGMSRMQRDVYLRKQAKKARRAA